MNKKIVVSAVVYTSILLCCCRAKAQELFTAPPAGVETRWVSPENPTGVKAKGGLTNKGAKGNAFFIIAPGEKRIIFDVKGAGIIHRIWFSGSIAKNPIQKRSVRIDMFWDGASKPAVSAPVGDFFGLGMGLRTSYENALFASPEANSMICKIPMPYRKSARVEITNESKSYVLLWYDIDYLVLPKLDSNALYFHAYWSRTPKTEIGKDFELLPQIQGAGRYLGANICVIGNPDYADTWFGEGEAKIYLDGDGKVPTLVGTGTEDYIGSGWGQGQFFNQTGGSLLADTKNDVYAFYRYHTIDPVYFHADCKVTLQQIGSAPLAKIKQLLAEKPDIKIIWMLEGNGSDEITNIQGNAPQQMDYLDLNTTLDLKKDYSKSNFANFYRSDDVTATAYFYLNKPESNLPDLPALSLRMYDLQNRVFDKVDKTKL